MLTLCPKYNRKSFQMSTIQIESVQRSSEHLRTFLATFRSLQKWPGHFRKSLVMTRQKTQKKLAGVKSCYSFHIAKPAFAAVKPDILNRPQSDYFGLYLPAVGY